MLRFSFTEVKGRGFFFILIGPGEEIFLSSVFYHTLVSCQDGARSVIENCGDIRSFDLISKAGHRPDPEDEIYLFSICDSRGQKLAESECYYTEEERVRAMRFLRMNIKETKFDEESWNKPLVL
jgi:hypothetical protein